MVSPDLLVPPHVAALRRYEPGLSAEEVKQQLGLERVAKLASNENPLGSSPRAIEAAQRALTTMARYPDGGAGLRRRLAERFHVKMENVIVGSGSEGIIANVVRTFLCDNDEVLTTEAAFLGFQVLARGRGVTYRTVPYKDWQYDLPALADAGNERTKLIYLANPNNPTGTFFTRTAFEEFHARVPERVLIILDEAYFEFAQDEPTFPDSMNYRFDNVITLRTFSKAYGLAAARIGYGFAHENLISMLLKVKLPFEPSGISAAAALGALEDEEFVRNTVRENARGRAFLQRKVRELGFRALPSAASFVTIVLETEEQADHMFRQLLHRGVIVRPLKATGLPKCLRISVGTPDENEMCVEALKSARTEMEMDLYAGSH
ncbi:MAG: histidinol-phosphate transaminase [Acidobacteriaceae bacterium]|nr:histidinol-phosphate transaminase [Acidobacteriaceae bacterium]